MEKKIINEMFAFVAQDEGGEGIMGAMMKDGVFMPLVGADMLRAASLVPIADKISKLVNKPYRILRFTTREDITDTLNGLVGGKAKKKN